MYDNQVQPLPLWEPSSPVHDNFLTGMQFHAPFIATKFQQRSDLGDCIISTRPPHIVARVHAFRTNWDERPGKDAQNAKQKQVADKHYALMQEYLNQRKQANENGAKAWVRAESVSAYIESQNRVYDEEFDEPRYVAKVPNYNIYLELVGCMDAIADEDIDWKGEHGVLATLNRMALWAANAWDNQHRMGMRSQFNDEQPLPQWHEDFNPELRPWLPKKMGLGHSFIDPSRREDLLYSKAPASVSKEQKEMDRFLKEEVANQARRGIAPENYGK